jgi:hypothetical protein
MTSLEGSPRYGGPPGGTTYNAVAEYSIRRSSDIRGETQALSQRFYPGSPADLSDITDFTFNNEHFPNDSYTID